MIELLPKPISLVKVQVRGAAGIDYRAACSSSSVLIWHSLAPRQALLKRHTGGARSSTARIVLHDSYGPGF
jgi:hypothetical protein